MKRLLVCSALLCGLLLSSVSSAQDAAPPASAENTTLSPVAQALSVLSPLSGSFNRNADYYIYLYSAGWCGPCKRIMPRIVQLYKETLSKNKRVEMVLFCADSTVEEAKNYLNHYDVNFFTVLYRDNPGVDHLPGSYPVRSIPHCIAVDKNGTRLFAGHAAVLFRNLNMLE